MNLGENNAWSIHTPPPPPHPLSRIMGCPITWTPYLGVKTNSNTLVLRNRLLIINLVFQETPPFPRFLGKIFPWRKHPQSTPFPRKWEHACGSFAFEWEGVTLSPIIPLSYLTAKAKWSGVNPDRDDTLSIRTKYSYLQWPHLVSALVSRKVIVVRAYVSRGELARRH